MLSVMLPMQVLDPCRCRVHASKGFERTAVMERAASDPRARAPTLPKDRTIVLLIAFLQNSVCKMNTQAV